MLEVLFWPFIAGLVLTGIHAYYGLHVLARGIIFVDLSLAQVAALGVTVAIFAGHTVQSPATYWYALAFALAGAVLFSLARRIDHLIQQEAVIGIVYAVCAAVSVLVLDRAPQGAEHIKQILIGSILTVGNEEVIELVMLYAGMGLLHWFLRRPLIQASFAPASANPRMMFVWDVIFYGSFAVVVTSSVRIAGVLLVFSYLIVPAAMANMLVKGLRARLLLAWTLGGTITAGGLAASWFFDLPTGPAIVACFGTSIAAVAFGLALRFISMRGAFLAAMLTFAVAGVLTILFPKMDQPWLDGLETVLPILQDGFLTEKEKARKAETLEDIARANDELTKLKAQEQEVRWGRLDMSIEMQSRMRQYIAGRSEILAGDKMVLQDFREKARARQQFGLGIPLLLLGAIGLALVLKNYSRNPQPADRSSSVASE